MPKKVLNLELSSGAFSAAAAFEGVAALELSVELSAEPVAEPVAEPAWAVSGWRSAMGIRYTVCSGASGREEMREGRRIEIDDDVVEAVPGQL
jgi:hypothetical protein